MYITLFSLVLILLIWSLHYQHPKTLIHPSYEINGHMFGLYQNSSQIPNTFDAFHNMFDFLNKSRVLNNISDIYWIGYWPNPGSCQFNNNYFESASFWIAMSLSIYWISVIVSYLYYYCCGQNVTRIDPSLISTLKICSMLLNLLFVSFVSGFDMYATMNEKAKGQYLNYPQYNVNGEFNMTRNPDFIPDQYELLQKTCNYYNNHNEIIYVKFTTFNLIDGYSNYQKADLAMLIPFTCVSFCLIMSIIIHKIINHYRSDYEPILDE